MHDPVRPGRDTISKRSRVGAGTLQALADTAGTAAPLRRRAALVVGRWVARMGEGDRPAAYGALLALLESGDAAMQLAAISALQVAARRAGATRRECVLL